jgi:hypothetical protein
MRTTPETVPTTWSTADENFFRAVADLFAPAFLLGGAVLLGSYDLDPAQALMASPAITDPDRLEPAASWPLAA